MINETTKGKDHILMINETTKGVKQHMHPLVVRTGGCHVPGKAERFVTLVINPKSLCF
jgi:hypothetical protein